MKRYASLLLMLLLASRAHGQWIETNGPFGTWQYTLGVHGSMVFAGNTSLFSFNTGMVGNKVWKPTGFSVPFNRYVTCFASIGSKLLVGLDSGYTGNIGNAVYSSTDDGTHWELSSTGLTDNTVNCFAVNDSFVFAGSYESGVFRSSDLGATWVPSDSGFEYGYVISLVTIAGCVLAGTEGGQIFRSKDNGRTWIEVDSTLPSHSWALTAMLFADNDSEILASMYSEGLYSSTDEGASWHLDSGLASTDVNKVVRSGSTLIAATNTGMFLSSDDGTSWVSRNNGLPNSIVGDMVLWNSVVFISTINGIFYSTNTGANWEEIDSGLTQYLQTNVLFRDGQNIFAGTYSGMYLSTDSGMTWVQHNVGLSDVGITAFTAIHTSSGPVLFAGTSSGPFRSTDYGGSWSLVDSGFPNFPSDDPEVLSFATIDTFLYAVSWYGDFIRSTNLGTRWQTLNTPFTSLFLRLVSNRNTLFAGGIFNSTSTVFLSQDQGFAWDILGAIAPTGYDYQVNAIKMDTDDIGSLRLYVDAYGDTFDGNVMSTDSGSTWVPFNAGLDSLDKESIACFDDCGKFLLCGCPHGFYFSSQNRDHWSKFNQGLSDSDVYSIASTNSNIFIGTDSGVWRRPVTEMIMASGVSQEVRIDKNLSAYPNPLTHSTTLHFTSAQSGYATVTIVNQLGVEVARVFAGELGAGEHSFQWSAPAGLPDGMYECVVRMNGTAEEIRIIVAP